MGEQTELNEAAVAVEEISVDTAEAVNKEAEMNTTSDAGTADVSTTEATTDSTIGVENGEETAVEDMTSEDISAEGEVATGEMEDGAVSEDIPTEDGALTDDAIMNAYGDMNMEGGMMVDPTMGMGMEQPKASLLSSWPFVIGISVLVLLVSVAIGVLLAKRKIKKGIELYED